MEGLSGAELYLPRLVQFNKRCQRAEDVANALMKTHRAEWGERLRWSQILLTIALLLAKQNKRLEISSPEWIRESGDPPPQSAFG